MNDSVIRSPRPTAYTAKQDERLEEIAERYGISVRTLTLANPQLFPNSPTAGPDAARVDGKLVVSGLQLNIPKQPMSTLGLEGEFKPKDDSAQFDVKFGWDKKWNPTSSSASTQTEIKVDPLDSVSGDKSVSQTMKGGVELKHDDIGYKLEVKGKDTISTSHKDGKFEVEIKAELSRTSEISGKLKGNGASHSNTEGGSTSYKVVLPSKPGDNTLELANRARQIDITDPNTIPDGASVVRRSDKFTKDGISASLRHVKVGMEQGDSQGHSSSVTRKGNELIVTIGPNQAVDNSISAGVELKLSKHLDAETAIKAGSKLESSQLRTVSFDLNSPDGIDAYKRFAATGAIPDKTPGMTEISRTARKSRDDELEASVKGTVGPVSAEAAVRLPGLSRSATQTTYPDKSYSISDEFKLSPSLPMRAVRRFDQNGEELTSQRTYQMQIDPNQLDKDQVKQLNQALGGGGNDPEPVKKPGQPVMLNFSEKQMQGLMAGARTFAGPADISADSVSDFKTKGLGNMAHGDSLPFASHLVIVNDHGEFVDRVLKFAGGISRDGNSVPKLDATITPTPGAQPDTAAKAPTTPTRSVDAGADAGSVAGRGIGVGISGPVASPAGRESSPPPDSKVRDSISPNHPDYGLFTALRDRLPAGTSDEKVAQLMLRSKQEGIHGPERLERVDIAGDKVQIVGKTPGFRFVADLSESAPPLQDTLQRSRTLDEQHTQSTHRQTAMSH